MHGGSHHHQGDPKVQKCWQRSKCFQDVRVISTRSGDCRTQLGEADRTQHREQATRSPHNEGHADGTTRIFENPFGTDKYSGANDRADNERDAIEEAKVLAQES